MTKEEQEAQAKVADEKGKVEKTDEPKKTDLTPEQIAEIAKNPGEAGKLIESLLAAKLAANHEAWRYRIKIEGLDKAQKEADDKTLLEQGKFKELAEKHKAEAEDLKKMFAAQRIDFELKLEAQKAGIIDAGDAVRLCDRAGLKLSDDFATVEGAKEAVETLKKAKPYLFSEDDEKIPPPGIGRASLKGIPIKLDDSVHGVDRIAAGLANQKKK